MYAQAMEHRIASKNIPRIISKTDVVSSGITASLPRFLLSYLQEHSGREKGIFRFQVRLIKAITNINIVKLDHIIIFRVSPQLGLRGS
jgi:hypothetical protein